MSWIRARFMVRHPDYRPIKWPPLGPYWSSGTDSNGWSVVIAYVKRENQISEFWPEAVFIDTSYEEAITFTDRFPQPDWWVPKEEEE